MLWKQAMPTHGNNVGNNLTKHFLLGGNISSDSEILDLFDDNIHQSQSSEEMPAARQMLEKCTTNYFPVALIMEVQLNKCL